MRVHARVHIRVRASERVRAGLSIVGRLVRALDERRAEPPKKGPALYPASGGKKSVSIRVSRKESVY